jgi:thiol:disulfide interchange protein
MRVPRLLTVAAAAGFVLIGGAASPQINPVKFTVQLAPGTTTVAPGSTFRVLLTAKMDEGWHLYSITQPPGGPIATRVSVSKGQLVTLAGTIDAPEPRVVFDQNFGMDTELYDGEATFSIPLKLAADARAGALKIAVETYFQACNDQFCLPPRTVKAEVEIRIEGAGAVEAAIESPAARATAAAVTAGPVSPASGPASTGQLSGETLTRSAPSTDTRPPAAAVASSAQAPPGDNATPVAQSGVFPGSPVDTSRSLWSFLWLAMTMGALSLLTPCVFPMIPVTVSYFTSQAAGSRKKAVGQALTYMVGIIVTFTSLGMAMALLVGATGLNRFAASPWVNLVIGVLFVGFALSLFGFYEIQIPSSVLRRLDAASQRSGSGWIVGTLLMALTFTVASVSCTAPFIGTLLVMAAGGDWQWPLIGMLAFSTVLAFPFFILALLPQLLARLPRSGGWMTSVKVLMGFLVFAASTKFLSNADVVWGWGILTHDVVLAGWVASGLLMTAYVLGMFRFQHDAPVKHVGIVRLMVALACGTLAFWLASGLAGQPLGEIDALLPLRSGSPVAAVGAGGSAELTWLANDLDGALAEARRTARRVFVDFTGYTCTNCKWMETNMFPREDVRRELERYVRVRLYTDGEGEIYRKQQQMQQERFKTIALPFYAVLEADGTAVATFPGLTRNPAEFVRFLQQAR